MLDFARSWQHVTTLGSGLSIENWTLADDAEPGGPWRISYVSIINGYSAYQESSRVKKSTTTAAHYSD